MQPDELFFARVTAPAGAGGTYICRAKKEMSLKTLVWRKQFQALKVESSSLTQVFRNVRDRLPVARLLTGFIEEAPDGNLEKAQRPGWPVRPG